MADIDFSYTDNSKIHSVRLKHSLIKNALMIVIQAANALLIYAKL